MFNTNTSLFSAARFIAFLADIHANAEALDAVLKDLKTLGVDQIVVLGDLVGYGPDPEYCIDRVSETTRVSVVGNHDRAAACRDGVDELRDEARQSIEWTRSRLSADRLAWLADLPHEIQDGPFHFVHGSPFAPEDFHYVLNPEHACRALAHTDRDLVFVGHSHAPAGFRELEYRRIFTGVVHRVAAIPPNEARITPGNRHVINVGGVGQPRDGDPRAAYGLFDLASGVHRWMRVPYDVEKTVKKIRTAGLPDSLAQRLLAGR